MKKTGVYPGTFDPITFGHIDVIQKSLKIVSQSFSFWPIRFARVEQSWNDAFIPWPKKGTTACAASPISNALPPKFHGLQ